MDVDHPDMSESSDIRITSVFVVHGPGARTILLDLSDGRAVSISLPRDLAFAPRALLAAVTNIETILSHASTGRETQRELAGEHPASASPLEDSREAGPS